MPLLPNALTLKLIRTIPPPFHRLSKPARKFIHTRDITPSCKKFLKRFWFIFTRIFIIIIIFRIFIYFFHLIGKFQSACLEARLRSCMIHLSFACNEKSIRTHLHFYKLALVVNLCFYALWSETFLIVFPWHEISHIYFQKKITNGKPILNNVFALCFIPVSIKLIYKINLRNDTRIVSSDAGKKSSREKFWPVLLPWLMRSR